MNVIFVFLLPEKQTKTIEFKSKIIYKTRFIRFPPRKHAHTHTRKYSFLFLIVLHITNMDSNRLYPQSISLSNQQSANGKHNPQKLTLRRRCRSECLQMAPVIGHQTEPKPIVVDNTDDVRRKIAHQPVFRNMLMKYSSSTILRNQDSAKNIFTFMDNRKTNHLSSSTAAVPVNSVRLKNTTKENISKSATVLVGGGGGSGERNNDAHNHFVPQQPIIGGPGRDVCTNRLYNGRMVRSSQDFFEKNHNQPRRVTTTGANGYVDGSPQKVQMGLGSIAAATTVYWKSSPTSVDSSSQRRRVRARSESESQELYQTTGNNKCSSHKNHKCRGYDVSYFFLLYSSFFILCLVQSLRTRFVSSSKSSPAHSCANLVLFCFFF